MTNEACRIICAAIIGGSIVLSSLIIGLCFGNKDRYETNILRKEIGCSGVFDTKTGRLYRPKFNEEKQKTDYILQDYIKGGKRVLNP